MLSKKLNKSDYVLLTLYFTVFILLTLYDYTYYFHQVEYTIIHPDGSTLIQQNATPELKGYLIGTPASFLCTLGIVLTFYLWLIPKYLIESKNYLWLLTLGIMLLIIFGMLKLWIWLWINNVPEEAYPSFIDFTFKSINTSAVNAGLPLGSEILGKRRGDCDTYSVLL